MGPAAQRPLHRPLRGWLVGAERAHLWLRQCARRPVLLRLSRDQRMARRRRLALRERLHRTLQPRHPAGGHRRMLPHGQSRRLAQPPPDRAAHLHRERRLHLLQGRRRHLAGARPCELPALPAPGRDRLPLRRADHHRRGRLWPAAHRCQPGAFAERERHRAGLHPADTRRAEPHHHHHGDHDDDQPHAHRPHMEILGRSRRGPRRGRLEPRLYRSAL